MNQCGCKIKPNASSARLITSMGAFVLVSEIDRRDNRPQLPKNSWILGLWRNQSVAQDAAHAIGNMHCVLLIESVFERIVNIDPSTIRVFISQRDDQARTENCSELAACEANPFAMNKNNLLQCELSGVKSVYDKRACFGGPIA